MWDLNGDDPARANEEFTDSQREWLQGVVATANKALNGQLRFSNVLFKLAHDVKEIVRYRGDLDALVATGFLPMNQPDGKANDSA